MIWLYKPNKATDYQGLIHPQDNMIITWTYQHLMDVAVANYGRPMTEEKLKKALKDQLDMVLEDMQESFDLCKAKMISESNKEYVLEECIRQWNENQKEFYGSWDEQTSETKSKYYNEMYELLVE